MARRSAVRNGPVQAAGGGADVGMPGYPQGGYPAADPWDTPDAKGRRGKSRRGSGGGGRWSGSGGRWWVWLGRIVLWAFIIVVLVNGIRAPFERFTATDSPSATTGGGRSNQARLPEAAVSSYALAFTGVYLNYDQANAPERQKQLGNFLAAGIDPQLGWDTSGKSTLQFAQVSSVEAKDANHALVTLLARANGRFFRLAVPVYVKDGTMAISGRPAILPPPPKAAVPAANQDRDSAVESELQEPLSGFFRAYGSGDTAALQRYAENSTAGLGGAVAFNNMKEIVASRGNPDTRTVTATVIWQLPPAQPKTAGGTLEQTYELSMVKKDGKWYVRDIKGSTLPSGQ